jgi:hypothetical protein
LDLVDMVGDQAVGFSVDVGRGLRRWGLDQAEHPPAWLIDPVPQVPHVVSGLRLQVGEWALATSSMTTLPTIS